MSRYDPLPPVYRSVAPRESSRPSTPRSVNPSWTRGSPRPSAPPHPPAPTMGSISLPRLPYDMYGQGSIRAMSPPIRPRTSTGVPNSGHTSRASTPLRAVTPSRLVMPPLTRAPAPPTPRSCPHISRLDALFNTGAELSAGRLWDVREHPMNAITIFMHARLRQATYPAVKEILISVGPWSFPVTATVVCVTVGEVLEALHAFLVAPLTYREWTCLGTAVRRRVKTDSRRVDALGQGTMFAGLRRESSSAGNDVWVLQLTGGVM